MIKKTIISTISLVISLFFCGNVMAGQTCEEVAKNPLTVEKAINKAVNINNILNNTEAKVVLIARVGQDLSKYNLKYSHVGFLYKKENTWEVYHELNNCGSDKSDLYIEGLANFFLDDMLSYDSKIFVPSNEVQQLLYPLLTTQIEKIKNFHEKHYNMLAYPFATKYQNSNQWVLEVLSQAISKNKVINREESQKWLKENNYQPTTLNIDAMTRLGARMFKANIAFDDQPFGRRMSGYIDTITVDSIYSFLEKVDLGGYFIESLNNEIK